MKHMRILEWLTLAMLLLLVAGLSVPSIVSADPATGVSVEPAGSVVSAGETFSVDIFVDPDTDIAGIQFYLSFDASLLTANSVTEGNLLKQGGASTFFQAGTIDNAAGTISGVVGAIMTPGEAVSQSGTFVTISFTAGTADGTSALDLSNVTVGDINGQAVGLTVIDGQVTIGAPPEEYAITFHTVPGEFGNVAFAGLSYSDGETLDKTAGTYAVAAAPGGGYYFDRWETTGGLSVASSTSATTTCTVSGAGTLSMVQTQTPQPEYTVTFGTVPEATGSTTFGGINYSDGDAVDVTAGTYALAAVPGNGYYFDRWETTGGLSVASSTSAATTCTVSGAGTLRMVQTQTPPPEYTVTFDAVPEATGSTTFGGINYSDGDAVDVTAGTYALAAVPGNGYYFDRWETTGGLSVASSTSAATTCTVSGAGTLRMVQTQTAPPEGYAITFYTDPTGTGSITFTGASYSDGGTVTRTAGTCPISAVPGTGYYFDKWVTTGGLSVASSGSADTTCEVSDAGTLKMVQTTTAPPVDNADHPISRGAIVAISIVAGAAIIAGIFLLVRRRRRATV